MVQEQERQSGAPGADHQAREPQGSKAAPEKSVTVDDIKSMLRDAGLRATGARVAVLRLLLVRGGPTSHAEACIQIEDQGFDRATIYRNLMDLTDAGILRRTDLGDHTWRFELATGHDDAEHHPHFVCNECGTVECLPDEAVSLSGRAGPKSVRGRNVEIQLRGVCDDCD